MPNQYAYTNWVTMESMRTLKNALVVASEFNTDQNSAYTQPFPVGETVQVKLPQRFTVSEGLAVTEQAINRKTTPVTMDQTFSISWGWDSVENTLKQERGREAFLREYVRPAMEQMAQEIDSRAALWAYQNCPNVVGALGTDPSSTNVAQAALTRLMQQACPAGDKNLIVAPSTMESVTNGSLTLFNDQAQISKAFKAGYFGTARGFDWKQSMSLYQHTAGTWAGAVTVNGAGQSGTSLNINCTSGDTFKKGDVISIASRYSVNPSTRRSTGTLFTFVVAEDFTASASTGTLSIYTGNPGGIIGPGPGGTATQYQNIDALPADTAALTLMPGTTSPNGKVGYQNLALHRNAYLLVSAPLPLPTSQEMAQMTRDPQTGIAIRAIKSWDVVQKRFIFSIDTLLGFGNAYPASCAVRVQSA